MVTGRTNHGAQRRCMLWRICVGWAVMPDCRSLLQTCNLFSICEPCSAVYSSLYLQAFDDLLLLKRGGLVIYMGSLGERSVDLVKYFQSIPGVPPIREGLNPATWMLEISTLTQEERIGVDFADCYRESELFRWAQW